MCSVVLTVLLFDLNLTFDFLCNILCITETMECQGPNCQSIKTGGSEALCACTLTLLSTLISLLLLRFFSYWCLELPPLVCGVISLFIIWHFLQFFFYHRQYKNWLYLSVVTDYICQMWPTLFVSCDLAFRNCVLYP